MGYAVLRPGLASQPRVVDQLCRDARTMLRLVSPRISAAQDEKGHFGHCQKCNPPNERFTCVICGFWTEAKWQYKMHIESMTGPCMRMAEKKAKKWADKA